VNLDLTFKIDKNITNVQKWYNLKYWLV